MAQGETVFLPTTAIHVGERTLGLLDEDIGGDVHGVGRRVVSSRIDVVGGACHSYRRGRHRAGWNAREATAEDEGRVKTIIVAMCDAVGLGSCEFSTRYLVNGTLYSNAC